MTCTASVFVSDDRWGGFLNHCELEEGHDSPHQRTLRACDPLARMIWEGNYEAMS